MLSAGLKSNRRLASYALIFVGLLATTGMLGGSDYLALFGHASLASPFLVVYSEPHGYRAMELRSFVTLTMIDDNVKSFEFGRETYNMIASQENPFNRHILTLGYMAAVFMLLDRKDAPLREQILRQGFCGKGPMTRYLGIESKVAKIEVEIRGSFPRDKLVPHLELQCRGGGK